MVTTRNGDEDEPNPNVMAHDVVEDSVGLSPALEENIQCFEGTTDFTSCTLAADDGLHHHPFTGGDGKRPGPKKGANSHTIDMFAPYDTVIVCPNHPCRYAKKVQATDPGKELLTVIPSDGRGPETVDLSKIPSPKEFRKSNTYKKMKAHVTSTCKFKPEGEGHGFFSIVGYQGYQVRPPPKERKKREMKQAENCPVGSLVMRCPGCGYAKEYERKLWNSVPAFPTFDLNGRHVIDCSKHHPFLGRTQQRVRMRNHILKCSKMKSQPVPRYYWNAAEVEQYIASTKLDNVEV